MKLEIFDPAMCCPTGVCGPTIDPELARVASALFILDGKGFSIKRHNLGSEPQAFIENKTVNERLNQIGPDVLPLIFLDGEVVKVGTYPTNEELAKWFQIEIGVLVPKKSANQIL